MTYGAPPAPVSRHEIEFVELMHWMYLPVWMPAHERAREYPGAWFPDNVRFLSDLYFAAIQDYMLCVATPEALAESYVYLTARRGWATPDNPLNRPGWHTDGFGTDDTNYVWCDRWPSRYAVHEFGHISDDHILSMHQFEARAQATYEAEPYMLYRLDPFVVHATPIIPPEGGWRSFVKISISKHRYDLEGNSHNYLFDYNWPMRSRADVRNDPSSAGRDYA